MFEIQDWKETTPRDSERGVKVRIAKVFKLPNQGMVLFNKELNDLTQRDLEDFCEWFNEAGFPTTKPIPKV